MAYSIGKHLRLTVFGQSHAPAIGAVIDGLPPGIELDMVTIRALMDRRRPGGGLATARREADEARILSGLNESGLTCGAPLCAVIENGDARSGDYAALARTPRPGHADYTARIKYAGHNDLRGGGQFSGRMMAPVCFAGAVCMQLLRAEGIEIFSHALAIGGVGDRPFDPVGEDMETLRALQRMELPVLDSGAGRRMAQRVSEVREQGDSVGGVVELMIQGAPAGLGEPLFDGLESRLSAALFAIPAVKGVEFGSGFRSAEQLGSEHNDRFIGQGGRVATATNRHGGILGGISSGMPILARVAFKPTPSIARAQNTLNIETMEEDELAIKGRHDPCVVPRAAPCCEAMAALVIYDLYLEGKANG